MPLCQPKYLAVLAYAIAAAAVHTISAAAAAAYLHCSPGYWRPCPGPDHIPADGEGPGVARGVHHARARRPGGPAGWDYLRARGRGASVTSSVTSTPQTAGWPHQPTTCQPPSAHQLISRSITMWTRLCYCAKCLHGLSVCFNFLLRFPRSLHWRGSWSSRGSPPRLPGGPAGGDYHRACIQRRITAANCRMATSTGHWPLAGGQVPPPIG